MFFAKNIRSVIISIFEAIVALGILVTIHELGHLLAARFFGVSVEKFSIGFGPKLISFTKRKTEFRISLIPLGGYLKMKGENPSENSEDSDSYNTKKWWKRAIIAFSGPFANFFLAILIFIISFGIGKAYEDYSPIVGWVNNEFIQIEKGDEILSVNGNEINSWNQIIKYTKNGETNSYLIERNGDDIEITNSVISQETWVTNILPFTTTKIGEVAPGLPAYEAGLMSDDIILTVDGKLVKDWYEMRDLITSSKNNNVKLTIERAGKTFQKSVKLGNNIVDNSKIIGITQALPLKLTERYNLFESIKLGTYTTVNFVAANYAMLYKLVANPQEIKANLGGPVMI